MSPASLETIFLAIGQGFSPAIYLMATKIQGILWSAADVTLIYYLLKIADQARAGQDGRKARWRYRLLALSGLLMPPLLLMPDARSFFIQESLVFGLQFAVLLHTLATDTRPILALLVKHAGAGPSS